MKRLLLRVPPGFACLLLVAVHVMTAATSTSSSIDQKAAPSARPQQLSRAVTLFATDDDGPEAERLLLGVIRGAAVTTADGATARYYLGRLYQRNYYMLGQRTGLDRAVDRYKEIHNRMESLGRPSAWYAESRFYKSLAYLEQGKWKDAYEAIDHIEPELDSEVEIDYLVWGLGKRSVNRRLPAPLLRDQYLTLLKRHGVVTTRPDGVDQKTRNAVLASLQGMLERLPRARS